MLSEIHDVDQGVIFIPTARDSFNLTTLSYGQLKKTSHHFKKEPRKYIKMVFN